MVSNSLTVTHSHRMMKWLARRRIPQKNPIPKTVDTVEMDRDMFEKCLVTG